MVPNAPLASAPGKQFHPPTLRMLEIHGGQVKRERYIYIFSGANTTEFRDNFPGFACWGALILRKLQSQFCACSAQPGK